jgi:hypothetical protein
MMQVREEEEEDAMDTIRRNRRDGDVTLELDEVQRLQQRFTRIGKEKAQSGHAYREMTEHVIISGASSSCFLLLKLNTSIMETCCVPRGDATQDQAGDSHYG